MALPYTYLLSWSKHNKFYYGVRFASNCHPSELWNTYFTSSKHVKEFSEQFGPPDIIKIRKIFTSKDAARLWETKVLKRMDVINNDNWLNKTNNISIDTERARYGAIKQKGIKKSDSHRENIRKANIGKVLSEGHKNRIKNSINNKSNEEKQKIAEKISKSLKGKFSGEKNPMYSKRGKDHPAFGNTVKPMLGKHHSDETKEKMRLLKVGKKQSLEHIAKRLATIKRNKELKNGVA